MTVSSPGPNGATTSRVYGATHAAPHTQPAPAPAEPPQRLSALPSAAALDLVHASRRELERALQRGSTPDVEALVGWEFRGINCIPPGEPPIARLAGIQKFIKGMFRTADGRSLGYNTPVVQNVLDGRWHATPSEEAPRRFGFYEITAVDPTSRDNHYLHAVLLDYGKGGNRRWDLTRGLRDYLVQVADHPDLFLGKAYAAVGPARLPLGFFVLERFRCGPTDPVRPA
jgi:hypothetical protein